MRFVVYVDRGGGGRWRLVAGNGRIVADSGEAYASSAGAERAARSVRSAVVGSTIVRRPATGGMRPGASARCVRFVVYKDRRGKYRWRLVAKNGRTIADSARGYRSERDARRAAASVRTQAPAARIEVVSRDVGRPLAIRVDAPPEDFVTNEAALTISGQVSEPAGLTINGEVVTVSSPGRFAHPVRLRRARTPSSSWL